MNPNISNKDSLLYDATARCRENIAECVKISGLMEAQWAALRLADFDLWAAGIGASSRGKVSLDARLSLKPEVRDVIAKILTTLKLSVDDCKELALDSAEASTIPMEISDTTLSSEPDQDTENDRGRTLSASDPGSDRSFSPWPDESSSESEAGAGSSFFDGNTRLRDAVSNIDTILGQLARISVAIRRSGTRSRMQKADHLFKANDHQELESHLQSVILYRPGMSLADFNVSKPNQVQQRLIQSNLRRRHRFLYAQRHAEQLERTKYPQRAVEKAPEKDPISQPKNIPLANKTSDSPSQKSISSPQRKENSASVPQATGSCKGASVKTGTTATAISDSLVITTDPTPSQAAPTQVSVTATKVDYPLPPEIRQEALFFQCPCCCQTLPTMMAKGNRWKKHISDDVCPYTCILENCNKENTLYPTKEGWKRHLLEDHRSTEYWVCLPCDSEIILSTESDFISHTKQNHWATIQEDQIPHLAPISKRTVPAEINECPLCDLWPSSDSQIDREALLDHIAEEVHAFSLRALPWPPEDGEIRSAQRRVSVQIVHEWLTKWGLTPPEAEQHLLQDDLMRIPDPLHYFRSHPYFAEKGPEESTTVDDSNDSAADNLMLLQNEGSLTFSDSENGPTIDEYFEAKESDHPKPSLENSLEPHSVPEEWKLVKTLHGHPQGVTAVVLTPDGTLVSTCRDGAVRMWDVNTGIILRTLKGFPRGEKLNELVRSPDGNSFAIVSDEGSIRLWDFDTAELKRPKGLPILVFQVAFSSTGKELALAGQDNTVQLWDAALSSPLKIFRGHKDSASAVAFSRDGIYLASASRDGTVNLWRTETGDLIHILRGHTGPVDFVIFSPDGGLLASASEDTTIRLWDPERGVGLYVLNGHLESVTALGISIDNVIASSSRDDTIKLWDSNTGSILQTLRGHSGSVWHVDFSQDGRTLASASEDGSIKLWSLGPDESKQPIEEASAIYLPDSSYVMLKSLEGHSGTVINVAFSLEGVLASSSLGDNVKLWDTDTGKILQNLNGSSNASALAFSPDGKTLVTGCRDGTVEFWDVKTGIVIANLEVHRSWVDTIAITQDGQTLASASRDTFVLWDWASGSIIHTLEGHSELVLHVSFSPGGLLLASTSTDTTIKVWEVERGLLLHTLYGHSDTVYSAQFSPNSSMLATGSADKTVRLWSIDGIGPSMAASLIRTLEGHLDVVFSAEFIKNGTTSQVLSSSADQTIKVWDVASGTCLHTLKGHADSIPCIAYSPIKRVLASGSRDKTIKLWSQDTGSIEISANSTDAKATESKPPFPKVYGVVVLDYRPGRGHTLEVKSGDEVHVVAQSDPEWYIVEPIKQPGVLGFFPVSHIELRDIATGQVIPDPHGAVRRAGIPTVQEWMKWKSAHQNQLYAESSWIENPIHVLHSYGKLQSEPLHMVFSLDSAAIAVGLNDGTIKLFDVHKGSLQGTLTGHSTYVIAVTFSSDGESLASCSNDGTIRLWDTKKYTAIQVNKMHSSAVYCASFSPDGTLLASGSENGIIRVWDARSGLNLTTIHGHSDRLYCLALSLDSCMLASSSFDSSLKLWDTKTGRLLHTLNSRRDLPSIAKFSPTQALLASTGDCCTIKLWDVVTGSILHTLKGHKHPVTSVSFHRDGNLLLSASRHLEVKLWDVRSGAMLRIVEALSEYAEFSPDGTLMVTLSRFREMELRSTDPKALLRAKSEPASSNSHLPDVTEVVGATYSVISECVYAYESIAKTEGGWKCDCKITDACRNGSDCINRAIKVECTVLCCGKWCLNRRFQQKQWADVEVFETERKGFGLRTIGQLEAGNFVIEHIGEVLNHYMFWRREKQYRRDRIEQTYFMLLAEEIYLDATQMGNLGRFINHSCDPNCSVEVWNVEDKLRMGVFANRAIKPGEELACDYNVYNYGSDPITCHCGEANCRRFITNISTKLSRPTLEALGYENGDGHDPNNIEIFQPQALEEKDVANVLAVLLHCTERWIIVALLKRIQQSDDEKVSRQLTRTHGYDILRKILVTRLYNPEIVGLVCHILNFVMLYNTQIHTEISRLRKIIEDLAKNDDTEIRGSAETLLDVWKRAHLISRFRESAGREPLPPSVMLTEQNSTRNSMEIEQAIHLMVETGADINKLTGIRSNALLVAWAKGDKDNVRKLLGTVSWRHYHFTALLRASQLGYEHVVSLLLGWGVDINAADDAGEYPLAAASAMGHENVVSLLLRHGADIDKKSALHGSPLRAAAAGGYENVVKSLLDSGADVNMQDGRRDNALRVASAEGHLNIVGMLLGANAKVTESALVAASQRGHNAIITLLLDADKGGNLPDSSIINAVREAAMYNHEETLQLFFESNLGTKMQTALRMNALRAASAGGHELLVHRLLPEHIEGFEVPVGGALYEASSRGHEKIVELLLKVHADVDATSDNGATALQVASQQGFERIVALLLKEGADVNAQGEWMDTALHMASKGNHEHIVTLLLDFGADVNSLGKIGVTALSLAVECGFERMVKLLINRGADVNLHPFEQPILQKALAKGNDQIVEHLLEAGASPQSNTLTLEDFLESERHHLAGTLTPVTAETFAKWKKERLDKKATEDEAEKMKEATGRAIFEKGDWRDSEADSDEEDDRAWNLEALRRETEAARQKEEEERLAF